MSRKKDPKGARARILQAAEEIFARDGYAQARTQDIADRAAVNKAMLFYYFDSKERLFEAVLERLYAAIADGVRSLIVSSEAPLEKRLDSLMEGSKNFWRLHPGFLRLAAASRKANPERHAELLAKYIKPVYDELTALIEKGVAEGAFRPVDARQFVFSMASLMQSYHSGCRVEGVVNHEPAARARDFDAGMAHLSQLVRSSLLHQPSA